MTPSDGPNVSPLRSSEVPLASTLLAEALRDDPAWVHVVPDDGRRLTALVAITGVALRDALGVGRVLAARDGDRLAGVAVWMPPGRYPMTNRRKLRTVPAMAALALRMSGDVRKLADFGASLDAVFPTEPVWYLQVLGVHPDRQRQGLGQRLMQPVLTEAEAAGVACYLETGLPRNVPYYQRSGFTLIAPAGPLYPGGPPMARMVKPACAS